MRDNNLVSLAQIQSKIKPLLEQKNYQSAINILEDLLVNYPDNYLILGYLGLIYYLDDKEINAEEIWFNCLFNGTNSDVESIANFIYEQAEIEAEKNNFILANKLYKQVLEFNDNHGLSYLKLGTILVQKGELESAISCWQIATELDSNLTIAYYYQARQWQRIKEYQQAISNYQQAVNNEPNNLKYWYNLGVCYLDNQQLNLAFNCYQKCLEISDRFLPAYGELGYLNLINQNIEATFNYWQTLVKKEPKFFSQYLEWLTQLPQQNNSSFNLVSQLITILISENLDLGLISSVLASLLFQRSQFKLTIFYAHKAIESNRELGENYYRLILSLIYTNQLDKIDSYLEKVQNIDLPKYEKVIKILNYSQENKVIIEQVEAPKIYQEKLAEWLKNNNLLETNYYPIYEENIIALKPPKSTEEYLNPSFQFPEQIYLPSSFVGIIPNGYFWLREDEASSAVISHDHQLIGDLSPESPALSPGHPDSHPRNHSLLKASYLLPSPEYIKGKVVVLAGLLNKVYFHWLFDILPRINLLELASIDLENIDYFIVDRSCHFQTETLTIFGIDGQKIMPLSFPLHIQAEHLIIPSFSGTIAWMPRWSCDYLRNKILGNYEIKNKPKKRIYISREKSSNRRLINELEIIDLLQQYEFEVINLEQLSVKKQAELLATAEIVIAPHGSGLSNIVFCQPHTKVIEIFAPFYVYPCYWVITNLMDLDYYYLEGEILGSDHFHQFIYPDSRQEDIYLNPQRMKQLLAKIIPYLPKK